MRNIESRYRDYCRTGGKETLEEFGQRKDPLWAEKPNNQQRKKINRMVHDKKLMPQIVSRGLRYRAASAVVMDKAISIVDECVRESMANEKFKAKLERKLRKEEKEQEKEDKKKIDQERRVKYPNRNISRNQVHKCRLKMEMDQKTAQIFWPFGNSPQEGTKTCSGIHLPKKANIYLVENRNEILIDRKDVIFAEWFCEDSAWIEGEDEAKDYDGITFSTYEGVLLKLNFIKEAKRLGYEERENRRNARAETVQETLDENDTADEEEVF